MTFNENDVNRDQSGKFDTKTGAPAETELTTSAADDRYTAAYSKFWDQTEPAHRAAKEAARDAQLDLVRADIRLEDKGIVRAEVVWNDDWEALGRPTKFYDAEGNEVDLGVELDSSLDEFDEYDDIRRDPNMKETETDSFQFEVDPAPITESEHLEVQEAFWGHALDRLRTTNSAAQDAQLQLVRAEIGLENENIASVEVEWDDEWDTLGRPSKFFDADGNEVDLGVETDTTLDMFTDFHEVRRHPDFTETENGFKFNIHSN